MQNRYWWEHYCSVEKDVVSFLREDPCDWCGKTYTDLSQVKHPQQLLTKKILPPDVFYKVFKNE